MAQNILVHAWDALTKRLREVEWSGGALKVAIVQAPGADLTKDVTKVSNGAADYKVLAANSANQVCGAIGAAGDHLDQLVLAVTAAGSVVILDNATTVMTIVYTGAVNGPSVIPVGKPSLTGAWKITSPVGITGMASGNFS